MSEPPQQLRRRFHQQLDDIDAQGIRLFALVTESVAAATDPLLDGDTEAARAIHSVLVTEAVRDARIGDRKVRKGQTIVLDPDDGLVAADSDRLRAILAGARAIGQGAELVTLYYGGGADLDEAESTARPLVGGRGGIGGQGVPRGQPVYRYQISAEGTQRRPPGDPGGRGGQDRATTMRSWYSDTG